MVMSQKLVGEEKANSRGSWWWTGLVPTCLTCMHGPKVRSSGSRCPYRLRRPGQTRFRHRKLGEHGCAAADWGRVGRDREDCAERRSSATAEEHDPSVNPDLAPQRKNSEATDGEKLSYE